MNFDGLRLDLKECKTFYNLQLGAYGGVPVHLFESSPNGDAVAGTFAQARIWQGNKVRLDYTYLRDKNFWGDYDSNLYGVSAWQTLYQYIQLYGQYTLLDGNSRDFTGRGTYYNPDTDLQFQASFYSLIKRQKDYAIDFDPFYAVVKEYFPYWQWRFSLYKGFGENFALMAGVDTRQVDDSSNEGMFNREFTRLFLTPIIKNTPYKGMDISVTGELWDSDGRDVKALGLDITHQCTENLKASIGTAYSLYKYDYYADTERDNVRDYYLKLNYKLNKDTKLSFSYAFEDNDFDYFHELQFGVKYEF